jgi:stage II sporulation protein M
MTVFSRLREEMGAHFRRLAGAYLFVTVLFTTGVIAGSYGAGALTGSQRAELAGVFETFVGGLARTTEHIPPQEVMAGALQTHLKTAGLIWLMGVTVIGVPVTGLVLAAKGFSVGFAVGFLVRELGLSGAAFSAVAVLPQNLLAIPALMVMAASSVSFSLGARSARHRHRPYSWAREFLGHTLVVALTGVLLLASSLIEGYVCPVLMQLVIGVI